MPPPAQPAPAQNTPTNAWQLTPRTRALPATVRYEPPAIQVPTPEEQAAAEQFREKQRQQIQAEHSRQATMDAQLNSMQRMVEEQQTQLASLQSIVTNNRTELLQDIESKVSSLETRLDAKMTEATRTKEKIDKERADKATRERESSALQTKMILEMLADLSSSSGLSRQAPPLATAPDPAPAPSPARSPFPSPPARPPSVTQTQERSLPPSPTRRLRPRPLAHLVIPPHAAPGRGRGSVSGRGRGGLHNTSKHPRSSTATSPTRPKKIFS